MNEKLIMRAALKYRDWMLKSKAESLLPEMGKFLYRIDTATEVISEIKRWSDIFSQGTSPRLQTSEHNGITVLHHGIVSENVYGDIATKMVPNLGKNVIENLKIAIDLIGSASKESMIVPLSIREAIEEIRIISNEWKNVRYKGGVLTVDIGDVVLEDDNEEVDLGPFRICLDLNDPVHELTVIGMSGIESHKGYVHPHVSESRLCEGEGEISMKYALCQGRLEDYFRIIESILMTYNPGSPHEQLSEWYDPNHDGEFYCDECSEWRSDDESYYCEKCDTRVCEGCSETGGCCEGCDQWRCKNCTTECACCNIMSCDICLSKCDGCSDNLCKHCICKCESCDQKNCPSCHAKCYGCDCVMCNGCAIVCTGCGGDFCDDCIIEECHKCEERVCSECLATCNQCHKDFCGNCMGKRCEHCGTIACESCSKQHRCLFAKTTI